MNWKTLLTPSVSQLAPYRVTCSCAVNWLLPSRAQASAWPATLLPRNRCGISTSVDVHTLTVRLDLSSLASCLLPFQMPSLLPSYLQALTARWKRVTGIVCPWEKEPPHRKLTAASIAASPMNSITVPFPGQVMLRNRSMGGSLTHGTYRTVMRACCPTALATSGSRISRTSAAPQQPPLLLAPRLHWLQEGLADASREPS